MKPRHQFNEAVIGLTEAVTALANYTRALKKISGNEAAIESRDAPDFISAVDVLEKVARQLARAANELRSLYACCGHADWVNNPDRGASFFVSLPIHAGGHA